MAETYCEKACDRCTYREALACPGCKDGPGRNIGGDCKLAQCCRTRGHDTCQTCNQKDMCGRTREVEQLPEYRLERQKREQAMLSRLERQIPLLAKCFTALFWLMIAANVPSLMSSNFTATMPGLQRAGTIAEMLMLLCVVAIYFLLGKIKLRYRKAALFMGLAVVAEFATAMTTGNSTLAWVQLLKIPTIVLSLLARFHLCNANSEALVFVDYALSEKWMQVWKWYIRCYGAMIAMIFVTLLLPVLGLLLVGLLGIGMGVLAVLELVYLYRMSSCFRDYARKLKQVPQET